MTSDKRWLRFDRLVYSSSARMIQALCMLAVGASTAFCESRWVVTTIVGTGKAGFSPGSSDPATTELNNPYGIE
jgi:hypothetical protein